MNKFKELSEADIERHNQRIRVGSVVAKVKAQQPQTAEQMRAPLVGHYKFTKHEYTKELDEGAPRKRELAYNPKIVTAFFAEHGIPEPKFEYQFEIGRKWKFDLAWPKFERELRDKNGIVVAIATFGHALNGGVALECDGGIWTNGGHNRGAQMKKTWQKENEAQILGWAILKCEPSELCLDATAQLIKRALHLI